MSSTLYSTYTIHDNEQFLANWQDVINEDGLTFWFGFKNGSHLHKSGDLDSVVQTWSNHVGAAVYVHYFKNLDAYRVGQIYNSEIALQVGQAVFILKYDPISPLQIQLDQRPVTGSHEPEELSLVNPQPQSAPLEAMFNTPHPYRSQHIRKPRNAWIIFRQEMMIKYRDQIGHLHTSEQSKVISQMWKKTPRPVKDFYTRCSHKEKAELLARYPDYKVQPRKSSEIKKRIKNKYPANMTVEKLNQWILDGQVQVQTAFSGDSCRVTRFTISDSLCLNEANKSLDHHYRQTEPQCELESAIASVDNIVNKGQAKVQAEITAAEMDWNFYP